jgi:hypothetical protein
VVFEEEVRIWGRSFMPCQISISFPDINFLPIKLLPHIVTSSSDAKFLARYQLLPIVPAYSHGTICHVY